MADVVQRSAMGEGECIVDEFAKFITHIAYNLFYNNVRIPHHLAHLDNVMKNCFKSNYSS